MWCKILPKFREKNVKNKQIGNKCVTIAIVVIENVDRNLNDRRKNEKLRRSRSEPADNRGPQLGFGWLSQFRPGRLDVWLGRLALADSLRVGRPVGDLSGDSVEGYSATLVNTISVIMKKIAKIKEKEKEKQNEL